MITLRLLLPFFLGVITLLPFALDHICHDKRTKWYRRIRNIYIATVSVTVILNIVLVIDDAATIKNQKIMISMLDRMQTYITTDYHILSNKYPKGYFLFASNKYTVIPSSKESKSNIILDWEGSEVKSINNSFIYIILKKFSYHPNEIQVDNLNIILDRKVGAIADGIYFNNIGLYVELLDDTIDGLIYVIGYKYIESVPKVRRQKSQKILTFINKQGLVYPHAIDTNTKKYINIRNWTLCSGWEILKN